MPTLVAPKPQEPLLLYLAATNQEVSAALVAQMELEGEAAVAADSSDDAPGLSPVGLDSGDAEAGGGRGGGYGWSPVRLCAPGDEGEPAASCGGVGESRERRGQAARALRAPVAAELRRGTGWRLGRRGEAATRGTGCGGGGLYIGGRACSGEKEERDLGRSGEDPANLEGVRLGRKVIEAVVGSASGPGWSARGGGAAWGGRSPIMEGNRDLGPGGGGGLVIMRSGAFL